MSRPLLLTAASLLLAPLIVPTATWAAGNFDGAYRGDQTITRDDNNPACSKSAHKVVVHVVDNSFSRGWGTGRGTINMTLHIAADGSFKTTAYPANSSGRYSGPVEMHGRITGNTLQAELGTNTCAIAMTLHKS